MDVKNGVVTLSEQVDPYSKKLSAENAAKRVAGVKAIAEDMQIGVSPAFKKTDAEIADAVLSSLKWHSAVQEEKVKIDDGVVTLERISPFDIQQKISSAFHRSATLDAANITAEVLGSKVTLRGKVCSFAKKMMLQLLPGTLLMFLLLKTN